MWAGTKSSSSPRASSASRRSASLPPLAMYHWRLVTISRGLSPFSKNFTGCGDGSGSPSITPASPSISTMRLLGGEDRLARELGVRGERRPRTSRPCGASAEQAAVPAEDGADRQLELAPPDHVGDVAERADHGDAGALVGAREAVRDHRHLDAEQRSAHVLAEQRLVALVVRVRHERDARGQQLGAGGLDDRRLVGAGGLFEVGRGPKASAVVRARAFAVLELGLRDGRAERDVPQRRRLGLVRLAAREIAQERLLGDRLGRGGDGLVRHATSRRTGPGGATAPRTASRPPSVRRSHSSTKLRREIGSWSAALDDLPSPPSNGGSKPST